MEVDGALINCHYTRLIINHNCNYGLQLYHILTFMSIVCTGGRRFSEGTSADREIQRTLMELLNQMDGFDSLGQVKCLDGGQQPYYA
jgi:hypothetical protein